MVSARAIARSGVSSCSRTVNVSISLTSAVGSRTDNVTHGSSFFGRAMDPLDAAGEFSYTKTHGRTLECTQNNAGRKGVFRERPKRTSEGRRRAHTEAPAVGSRW